MQRLRYVWLPVPLLGVLAMFTTGCQQNWLITGQVNMVAADENGDLTSAPAKDTGGEYITQGQPFSIRLDSVFIRLAKEIGGSEFLVYAEIYDVQPDDRQKLMRVLFKESHQAAGYLLSQRDRLVFGPIIYKGHPIRIRLFIVELDKEENEIASEILRGAVQVASTIYPVAVPFSQTAISIGDLFLALNEDDRELTYDFTLYPNTNSHGPYLRTGHYVLIKTENRRRILGAQLTDELADVKDEYGRSITKTPEDYARYFIYYSKPGEQDHPLREVSLSKEEKIYKRVVLRVMGGELWLQTVALEYRNTLSNKLLMADERFLGDSPSAALADLPTCIGDFEFSEREYYVGSVPQRELVVTKVVKDQNEPIDPIRLGQRVPYREKTYAVITVAKGGTPIDRSLFEELSVVDQQALEQALQSSLTADQVNKQIRTVAKSIMKTAATRQVVREVTLTMRTRPGMADSADLPWAYLQRLRKPPDDDADHGHIKAHNEAIIDIVAAMVQGFPYGANDAKNAPRLQEMKDLTASSFKANGDGTFTLLGPADSADTPE